ncbi:MAG: hypothetical protein IJU82_00980 [Ruminiclostridium sp.]|nr:hypothetical protein [Ruminiclostridium sp.]
MQNNDRTIIAECPLFVCRICHTKTGHPHQIWCTLSVKGTADCTDCLYRQDINGLCGHPYKRKGGDA